MIYDFLKIGYNEEFINEFIEKNTYAMALDIAVNYKRVGANLKYLKSKGVTTGDEILMNYSGILTLNSNDFIDLFTNASKKVDIINLLNTDIEEGIDILWEIKYPQNN